MDKNFLEELLKKQKIGNLRNIHLNCNPGRQINRLDIHLIDEFIPSFSNIFLKRLLKNDIFKIDIDLNKYKREFNDEKDEDEYYERKNNVYRKLEKIYQEYNDLYDEYGYKTFSFGYPIVCKKFISNGKEKLLQAPLFLWNLDISKNFSGKYCFNIKRDEDNEVLINGYLLSFLLYEENIKIDHENDFEQNYDFKNLMDSFKEKLGIHDNFKIGSLEKFKTKEQLDLQIQGFEILPYGLFGNFKSQKQSIIKDLNNCLDFVDEVNEDAENILGDMHSFSKIETDPSQFSIIEKLGNSKDIIIQGPPGTGKSQTITAILVNALDNGKKCLVVCDKRTALEIIRKNLGKDGLDKLSVLIDDVNKDRNYIVDQVRGKYSELGNKIQYLNTNFDENLYLKNIANFKENLDKYKKNFNNLRKNRLDKKNFKSLVGEYLKYKNLGINLDKEIHNYIQENSIDNTDIYNLYNGIINNIGKLYSDKFERSLLNNLGDNFFSKDLFDLRDELNEDLADLKKIIESLIKSKIDLKDIINSIGNQIRHLIKNVDLIVENILNNISEINSKSIEIYGKEIFDKKIYNPIQNLSKNNNALKEIYKEESSLYSGEHADEIFKYIENIFNQGVEIKNFYKSSAEAFGNDLNKIYKKQNELICLLTQSKKYGDEVYSFKGFPNFKIKFLSIFSKKYKDIFLRNEDITSKITELDILIKYYNIKFNIYKNFEKKKELENLSLILNDLGNNILKFNSFEWFKFSNIHSEKFEKDISSYKEFKINLNKYYKFLLDKVESFSIKLDKNFIENFNEDIIESERKNLEKLNKNLRKEISELDKIYEWKKYYLAQNGKDKNFIDMLIKNYKTSDISNIFRYHFIENILRNIYNEIPGDNDFIENFEKISDSLSNDQKKSIENRRNNMFIESVEEKEFLKKGFLQSLYNKRGNTGGRRNSLRKIIKTDFSIFSNAFPIVLANPSVCSSLFPLTKGLFDVVLFDEASQIRIEDSYCSLIRGKKHIICGDNKQMPPSSFFDSNKYDKMSDSEENKDDENEDILQNSEKDKASCESLLDFGIEDGYKEYMLNYHYRSEHPLLIEFSNRAFYKGKLISLPNEKNYIPIDFREINGIYDNKQGINEKEGKEVILLLKELFAQNKRTIPSPSIGIATFNQYQQEYIRSLIENEKDIDEDFKSDMNKYDRNTFFVKNLDTIQGDERDIIIISPTFGKRIDGVFIQNYGPINKKYGYRFLNVLITRAKRKVFILNSIPKEYYSQILTKDGLMEGKDYLYAYLSYSECVSKLDENGRKNVLNLFDKKEIECNYGIDQMDSTFEEEVYQYLIKYIDKEKIKPQYKVGKYRIDFAIIPLQNEVNKKKIAIECDGAAYHSREDDRLRDRYRQKFIEEKFGFKFIRIWSKNRFQNPEREIEKLLDSYKNPENK